MYVIIICDYGRVRAVSLNLKFIMSISQQRKNVDTQRVARMNVLLLPGERSANVLIDKLRAKA